MKRYVLIRKGDTKYFNIYNIFVIPFIYMYCKLKRYKIYVYERSDLNWKENQMKITNSLILNN